MPTIEIYREDLEELLGTRLPSDVEGLNEILSYVKGEVKLIDEEELTIELQDTNRPDLWCVEGLARALRGFLGIETGLKRYEVAGESGVEVFVDEKLKTIRPYIACSVVKEVKIDDKMIRQLMHLQDKMDQTYGRQRRRTSIGLYNFDLVTPPLKYGVSKPDEVSFVPLEFEEELTLREILEKHPKGIEYGHIVRPYSIWPIFMDSKGKVLSFPPIINSNDLGRITEETRNVLVEVTGTSFETVLYTLTNITLSLADRGGIIYSAKIHYPYEGGMEATTPKLETETLNIEVDYIRSTLGIDLKPTEIVELLEKARYGVVNADSRSVTVEVPCYRVDIMHPVDVVEDVAIAYNYNKIEPRWPQLSTVGGKSPDTGLRDAVREIMIGLGYQEILSFTMTNPTKLFSLMNIEPTKVVEVSNPKISYLTCLRNWLLPSLMEFLSHNLHVEYPQRVFEVGYCVVYDQEVENKTKDVEKLACATAHSNASFTEVRSTLDALLGSLGLGLQVEEVEHGSFIDGRVGKIVINGKDVGLIGEVHPQVLENWGIENPVAAFEVNLNKIRMSL